MPGLRANCELRALLPAADVPRHREQTVDYTASFREALSAAEEEKAKPQPKAAPAAPQEAVEEKEVLCPKCGAPMIRRVASKGSNAGNTFYGCSKFPACRGIVPIDL